MNRFAVATILCLATGPFTPDSARAAGLPLDPSQFSNLANLLDPVLVSSAVRTVGGLADHRPYDPVTIQAERGLGFELGLEATLVKVPPDFTASLIRAGISSPNSIPPALPMPKLHIRKSLGDAFSVGVSGIFVNSYKIIGGDAKIVLSAPEEGVSWGLRLAYSSAELGFVKTRTWSPQLLISKSLEFAEPYLGTGWQFINGSISLDADIMGIPFQASRDATLNQFFAFMGLMIRPTSTGLLLAVEGSYNHGGTSTLGAKVGLAF